MIFLIVVLAKNFFLGFFVLNSTLPLWVSQIVSVRLQLLLDLGEMLQVLKLSSLSPLFERFRSIEGTMFQFLGLVLSL